MTIWLEHGDMREVLQRLYAEQVQIDAIVTDPPYHLTSIVQRFGAENAAPAQIGRTGAYARASTGFMGKKWDGGDIAFQSNTWRLCYDLLPPGGHLIAFSGTRTYHRMAVAIEEAGFEIRDMVSWIYGSGFPKSHNVSKGIDKAAGAEREVIAEGEPVKRMIPGADQHKSGWEKNNGRVYVPTETAAATDAARQWEGWGTALKPSAEPVCLAQKPYTEQQQIDMMGSNLERLESRIWSMLPANAALAFSGLSQSEFERACASVQWSAAERSNTRAALSAQMDTSQCVTAILSSLNTVSLWRECWADASQRGSTSTIRTESSTTIDRTIWKSCLSKITPASIILAHKPGAWSNAHADPAARYLNAIAVSWQSTRELSALESALGSDATNCPDADDPKPYLSPAVLARKPLSGTVAQTVLKHGTGALNIDGCRIESGTEHFRGEIKSRNEGGWAESKGMHTPGRGFVASDNPAGRWPANVCHDGSDEVVRAFPAKSSTTGMRSDRSRGASVKGTSWLSDNHQSVEHIDSGSPARFFYTAKAGKKDRAGSKHPTVKPVSLMRWLVRLITPPGGMVLDPFAGSGTTGEACRLEGFDCTLVEREDEYVADIRRRLPDIQIET